MKKLSLFAFFCFLVFTVQAQTDFRPGFLVTAAGDTLKGEVNYKGDIKNALECTFRPNQNAASQTFKPNEIKGYGFSGGKFYETKKARIVNRQLNLANQFDEVPVTGNDSLNFMQVLVKGQASLYFMKDATSAPHFYLQKNAGPLQELVYLQAVLVNPKSGTRYPYKSKQYVGTLKIAFQDCPSLGNKIDKTDYKPSALQRLVADYNACVAPEQESITQLKAKPVLVWGAVAGVSFSELTIKIENHYLGGGDYRSKAAPTGGVFLNITMPATSEKLSLNNALLYTIRNYTADYNYQTSDLSYGHFRVAYGFHFLRLESAIRYTAPKRQFTPFGQLGVSNSLMLSHQENIFQTKYYLDYPGEDFQEADYLTPIFRKHQLGFVGGAGIKHHLNNGNEVFLQANYEFHTGFTKGIGVGSRSHNAAILVGIGF